MVLKKLEMAELGVTKITQVMNDGNFIENRDGK